MAKETVVNKIRRAIMVDNGLQMLNLSEKMENLRIQESKLAERLESAISEVYKMISEKKSIVLECDKLNRQLLNLKYNIPNCFVSPVRNNLILVCGRPGMGKTFLSQLILNQFVCADSYYPVIYAETQSHMGDNKEENSDEQLSNMIRDLYQVETDYSYTILDVDDVPKNNINTWLNRTLDKSRYMASYNPKDGIILVIDTIQFFYENCKKKHEDFHFSLDAFVRELKNFVASHDRVKVILTSELPRNIEEREDHRPSLNDLNAYFQSTDAFDEIIALYRENYYTMDGNTNTELIYLKSSNSSHPTAEVSFDDILEATDDI